MSDIFEQQLTCTVCLGLYEDPLLLPCLHTFCTCCLQRLVESSTRHRRRSLLHARSTRFNCPECRAEVSLGPNGVNGLPKNFQLANIVGSYKANKTDDSSGDVSGDTAAVNFSRQTCHICRDNFAVKLCLECIAAYCLTCLQASHPQEWARQQSTRAHVGTETAKKKAGSNERSLRSRILSLRLGRHSRATSHASNEGQPASQQDGAQTECHQERSTSGLSEADQRSVTGEDDLTRNEEIKDHHPLLNLDIVCGHHKGEHMVAFCFQCLTLACPVSILRHEGHLVLQLVDAILTVKDELTAGASHLRDESTELKISALNIITIGDKLKKELELVKDRIQLECDHLRILIKEREEMLLQETERVLGQDFLTNRKLANLSEVKAMKMDELAKEMQQALKPINTVAFLQRGLSMKKRIPNLERLYSIPGKIPVRRLRFGADCEHAQSLQDLDVIAEEYEINVRGNWSVIVKGGMPRTERLSERRSHRDATSNPDTTPRQPDAMTNRENIRNHYTPGHPASLATTVIYNNHVAAGHGAPSHPVYHHNPFYLYQRLDHNNTQQSYPPVPGSNAYYDVIQRQAFSNGRPQMPYSFPTFANMQSFPRNRGRHVNQHFQRAHESSAVGRGLDNVWQAATSANRLSIRTNGTVQYPPNTSMPHRGIDTGRDATPGFRSREAAATRTESGLHRRERDPSAQSSTPSVEDGDDVPDLVSSSSPSSDESADSLRQFANEEEGAAAAPLTTSPANEARRQEPLATDRQEQLHDNLSPDAQSNSEGLGRERNSGGVRTPPATVDDGPGEATLPDSRDSHVSNVNSQQVPNIGEYQPAYGATLRDPSAQSFFKLDRKTAHKSLEFLEQNKVQRIITPHNHNDVHGNNIPELPFSPTKHQPDRCRLCQYTDMSYSSSAAPLQDPHPMAPAKPEPADRQGQYVGPSCTVLADRAFTQGQHWLIVICQLPDVPLTRDWLFTFGVSSGRGKRDELLTADTCAWCMEVSGVGYRFVRHGNRVISLQESNIPTCHSDAGASQERQPGKLTMGLLLDMDNRSLTFYRIDTRRRLFTFNDVRAQVPLYPAFSIGLEGLTLEVRSVVPVPDYVNLPSQRQRTQQNQRGSGTITPV